MKSSSILLCPSWEWIISLSRYLSSQSLNSHLGYQLSEYGSVYVQEAPEYKSSNAGNLNILLLFLIYKMNFVIGTAY